MKTAVIITVRMKSSRLPRKALLEINGKTLLEHLIDRMKLAKLPDMIIVATSTHPDDAVLEEVAKRAGVECFRGSPEDKLARYLVASEKYNFDYMVDVSADNIFSSYELVDRIIEEFKANDPDVVFFRDLPIGASPIGLKMAAVEKVCKMKDEDDTEVYGPYFFESEIFSVTSPEIEARFKRPDIRLSIDYQEDFELAKRIFEELGEQENKFSFEQIIELFEKRPELLEINREAQERYEKNFKNLTPPKIKPQHSDKFKFSKEEEK